MKKNRIKKRTTEYVIGLSLVSGVLVGLGIVFVFFREPYMTKAEVMPDISSASSSAAILQPKLTQTEWPSPDGKQVLVMRAEPISQGQTKYSFSTGTTAALAGPVIFSQTVANDSTFSMPFNAWSPGNQYVFVEEKTPTQTHAYVFKASGEPLADGQSFLDVNAIFETKQTKFTLEKVTGWAAPTLLVINTQDVDSKPSPSFWFDIVHKSVTRLSTSFK